MQQAQTQSQLAWVIQQQQQQLAQQQQDQQNQQQQQKQQPMPNTTPNPNDATILKMFAMQLNPDGSLAVQQVPKTPADTTTNASGKIGKNRKFQLSGNQGGGKQGVYCCVDPNQQQQVDQTSQQKKQQQPQPQLPDYSQLLLDPVDYSQMFAVSNNGWLLTDGWCHVIGVSFPSSFWKCFEQGTICLSCNLAILDISSLRAFMPFFSFF